MEEQKKVLRILLKNYTKISYKGGIVKVIFDDCFEDIAEEIVKLFAIPIVSKRYLLEVITSKGNSLHCSVYDNCEKAQQMYGVLEHEWKGSTTEVRLTAFNAC